ncbi:MAG: phytanoyl-CoA dioxygenase family protein [Gammaproteobacteria bacterium]|jgi:ectoine hydroxylase-related dioxygenase (phytanoyl-CoA dioxygenase family)|nr:phytanoyl-CoA dioxygenase family protein [Gammaproteobacteria bacterium]
MLSDAQIEEFWRDGYLVAENGVSGEQLRRLQESVHQWVEESRAHDTPFGEPTVDGRPRFDMGEEHCAQRPALRRVNNPSEISAHYHDVMRNSSMVDMVADLIGANVKYHHCKINLKLPGSHTVVAYHQDFSYTPHTNDDIVTALLMLDDVSEENGCPMVVPGSHRGPQYSLFDGATFTGFVDPEQERALKAREVAATGKAGDVCLMHTRLLHGSAPNLSDRPRGLFICVYTAADAFPLARNPMPSELEGTIVRGERTRVARLMQADIELPEQPKTASFFTVQGQSSAGGE